MVVLVLTGVVLLGGYLVFLVICSLGWLWFADTLHMDVGKVSRWRSAMTVHQLYEMLGGLPSQARVYFEIEELLIEEDSGKVWAIYKDVSAPMLVDEGDTP